MYEEIRSLGEACRDYILQTRRIIHRNPELSLQEHRTAALIRHELDEMGISWRAIGETGTLATLPATEPGGYTVALRADIDALPVQENTGLPFASCVEGVMHACGHDGHAAMLLGAAKILSAVKKRPNTAVFVFQPAEEFALGARMMIDGGALDGVDVIYGSHVWPDVPAGKIAIADGTIMAGVDQYKIKVIGKGGHGSKPEVCHSPIPACTAIADGIHQVKSLSLAGDAPLALTVGYIKCGTAMNIIPDSGEIGGSIRWMDHQTQQIAWERIRQIAQGACAMHNCQAQVQIDMLCGRTSNDPGYAAQAREALAGLYGEDAVVDSIHIAMGSEDFSFYGEHVPTVFGLVGYGHGEDTYSLHNPHFTLDEPALVKGAALYAQFACSYKKIAP